MGNTFRRAERDDTSPAATNTDRDASRGAAGVRALERQRELAPRSSDGLDVILLWHPTTDELLVRVWDQRQHIRFEVRPERDMALDVYYTRRRIWVGPMPAGLSQVCGGSAGSAPLRVSPEVSAKRLQVGVPRDHSGAESGGCA
jgi:hypothetical protein